MDTLTIDDQSLPDFSSSAVDFDDTSFFQESNGSSPPQLPPPAVVRQESQRQGVETVRFEHLSLIVKFGHPSVVRSEEAQTLHAIGRLFSSEDVPVPELFAWRIDEGENFIYMSLVKGPTLGDRWASFTPDEKKSICGQLGRIVASLRRIRQPSTRPFIGSINSGPVQDLYFRGEAKAGPFSSVRAFNDHVQLASLNMPMSERGEDPYRPLLSDTCSIYFTHGDLHPQNIIISQTSGHHQVAGIVDWEQAGWYPGYWEYCKLSLTGRRHTDWHEGGWADSVMTPYRDELVTILEYWMWKCP